MNNPLIVFTKPWRELSLSELADLLVDLGVDGAELPVRPGYQVEPGNALNGLKEAVAAFAERDLSITSVAGSLDEPTIRACGSAGVKILRICVPIDMNAGYLASVNAMRSAIMALHPVLTESGVSVGIQNHYGRNVASALGIAHLLDGIAPAVGTAVLDFAHCSLDGEPPDMALDIVRDRVSMVNFKSAARFRINGPDEPEAEWQVLWTTAGHGGYSWAEAVDVLARAQYFGPICLPAEYGMIGMKGQRFGDEVVPLVRSDVRYLKELLGRVQTGGGET